MCWFSHDLEPYAFKALLGRRVLLAWMLLGSVSPDVFTKFFIESGWIPVEQHRGVGLGITHTLFFGLLVSALIYAALRGRMGRGYASKAALSFLAGQWSHVLLDSLDSVGLMALFPLSTSHYPLALWSYAAQLGHWGDLYVFYHSPALLIETAAFAAAWVEAYKFLTPRGFARLAGEEGLSKLLGPRRWRILYTLYFYYLAASLRLPAWIYKVWFSYQPSSEALALASRNALHSVFTNPWIALAALAVILATLTRGLYRLAQEAGGAAALTLATEGALLAAIALLVGSEPLMAALSTITAAATAYTLTHTFRTLDTSMFEKLELNNEPRQESTGVSV